MALLKQPRDPSRYGFKHVPVDLGGTADCAVMEAPRRDGAVYGEEYRAPDAAAVVDAVRIGAPIPPPPSY
jgi:8-hydroxy-5-deazaflavin:NADPH oxidoreductase